MIKHIQNFRGIENKEKKIIGHQKWSKTLVAHESYKQIDYMRHFWTILKKKKTTHSSDCFNTYFTNTKYSI